MKFTLEQARKYNGLSQRELAERLGIALQTYNEYEKYRQLFRVDTMHKFVEVVGLPIEDILFYEEKREPQKRNMIEYARKLNIQEETR